jgi:hypothetical protein
MKQSELPAMKPGEPERRRMGMGVGVDIDLCREGVTLQDPEMDVGEGNSRVVSAKGQM